MVGPPDMDHEENQHESDQEELVKQQVRCHDDVLFHGDEKGQFYRIGPLLNYPLHAGTPPDKLSDLVYSIAAVDASSLLVQTGDQRQGRVRERACAREINVYGRAITL